ncbi:hypothetical protein PsorP6_001811 [Peronosclerospora sorghi]|uniref:Uncharacterized protein n=1 Tax=Peronosclerospora sorghi TaxID=230839 RepID=A0ACC0WV91_9STRA|nr:hypothetical protein PsorP6_001811 [Peronosclerospora sorghi]
MSELKQSVQQVLDLIKVALQSGGSSSSSTNISGVALEALASVDIETAAEGNTLSEREEPEGASEDAVGEVKTTGDPAQGTSGDVGPERYLDEDVPKEFELQDAYDDYDEYHPDYQGGYDPDQQYSLQNIMPRRNGIMWRRVFTDDMATEDFIFLNGHSYTIKRRQQLEGVITEGGFSGIYADENEEA